MSKNLYRVIFFLLSSVVLTACTNQPKANSQSQLPEKTSQQHLMTNWQLVLIGGSLHTCTNRSEQNCNDPRWFHANQSNRNELVNIRGNKFIESTEILAAFAANADRLAKKKGKVSAPKLTLLTSSAGDSFTSVDFYQQVFSQAGFQVTWLPLDEAVNYAIQTNRCDDINQIWATLGSRSQQQQDQRAADYPELLAQQQRVCRNPTLLTEQIKGSDALFINGGDQSLSRAAFYELDQVTATPWLQTLQQQLTDNQLVYGGTSAGTAVTSSDIMISNGTSLAALTAGAYASEPPPLGCGQRDDCPAPLTPDSLTYQAAGGLALLPQGIIDTHFSERGRQARLLQLAAATNQPIVFGVDETTALALATVSDDQAQDFAVIGKHGVFFATNMDADEGWVRASVSYLLQGATGTIRLAQADQPAAIQVTALGTPTERTPSSYRSVLAGLGLVDILNQWCGTSEAIEVSEDSVVLRLQRQPDSQFFFSNGQCQAQRVQLEFSIK